MAPTPSNLLLLPQPSDLERQDRIQQYIDGVPDQPALDTVPTLGSPFTTPPASTLGSPYATPPPSLVGNEEQYTPSPVVVDWHEFFVSNNMSSTTSVAGGSGASGKDNKIDTGDTMSDTMGARDGAGSSGAPAVQENEPDKVVDEPHSDPETVIADTPPSQGPTGTSQDDTSQDDKNVGVGAEPSASADVKSPAASGKEVPHNTGMHLSKYAPKSPSLADWPPQIPRGPRPAKFNNTPRAPREPQNSGYHGQNQNIGHANLRDKVRTLENELREARQAVEAERKANETAVEKAESRTIKRYDIAVQQLLSEIIIDKICLVKEVQKFRVKELELAARANNVLTPVNDSTGENTATSVDEVIRNRVAQEIALHDLKVEARLTAKENELEIREQGIEFRENVAPIVVARALNEIKGDIRADMEQEMIKRMTEQQRRAYGQGFSECLETVALMKDFQAGRISRNDPKIAFIFDPTHPKNPAARLLDINRPRSGNTTSSSASSPAVNVNRGNATQMGRQHGSNSGGSRPRQHFRDIYHEDPNVGTRAAEPRVSDTAGKPPVPAERTPTAPKTPAANDSTPDDREPAHVSVPDFSSVAPPRRTAPDERVHKEDKTVDLIDLY